MVSTTQRAKKGGKNDTFKIVGKGKGRAQVKKGCLSVQLSSVFNVSYLTIDAMGVEGAVTLPVLYGEHDCFRRMRVIDDAVGLHDEH